MADRSYLYATDHLPGSSEWEATRELRSISEWNYDIPLVFKLLLSGAPLPVRSSIWETEEKIALAGEAKVGLEHLNAYLARLPAEAAPLVAEAQSFLSRPENCRRYFVLECGEIFDMEGDNHGEQNLALLVEIRGLPAKINSLPVPSMRTNVSFLMRLFGRSTRATSRDPLKPFYALGLGNWSSILYFQFEGGEA